MSAANTAVAALAFANFAPSFPAYDQASPDAQMLEAYENIRAARGQCHRIAELPADPVRDSEAEDWDDKSLEGERIVYGAWATTLEGVRTRLQLILPDLTGERWVDEALAAHGISAVCRRREQLDGNGQQLILACEELLHAEWEDALATYEKSVIDYEFALSTQSLLTCERQALLKAAGDLGGDLLRAITGISETAESLFCNVGQITQLMRTLAPTHDALSLKIRIAMKEGFAEEATPWVARDVAFLAGLAAQDSSAQPDTDEGAA